ncbi:MAG: DUF2400 family protein [Candidatus Egerieousia sp.]
MNRKETIEIVRRLGNEYNNPKYFECDPIIFPKHFCLLMQGKNDKYPQFPVPKDYTVRLQDVEIAAVIAAHLAWGRRDMIVRDTKRALDEMSWKPYEYIMAGRYRSENQSLHRTIKWSEFAAICDNLRKYYSANETLEPLSADEMRVMIYGQKSNPKMANKKIHMLRRWFVRNDGIVDLGLWKNTTPKELIIPLDVHVHNTALELGITNRHSADYTTAKEITEFLLEAFPDDPCLGDFALFAYSASKKQLNT